jgi:hypothetical protein
MSLKRCCCVFARKKVGLKETEKLERAFKKAPCRGPLSCIFGIELILNGIDPAFAPSPVFRRKYESKAPDQTLGV